MHIGGHDPVELISLQLELLAHSNPVEEHHSSNRKRKRVDILAHGKNEILFSNTLCDTVLTSQASFKLKLQHYEMTISNK